MKVKTGAGSGQACGDTLRKHNLVQIMGKGLDISDAPDARGF